MYNAIVFEKGARPNTPDTYFKESKTFEMICKPVNEKSMTGTVLGINKAENEKLLTNWLNSQIYVCVKTFNYLKLLQSTKPQHTCACSNTQFFQKHIKSVSLY
jgi:hypothetical protein